MTAKKAKEIKPVNITGKNAERAYKILNEVPVGDRTLYDVVFDKKPNDILSKLNPSELSEFMKISTTINALPKEKQEAESMKLAERFPGLLTIANDDEFEIRKALRLNEQQTHELAELYTGLKSGNFMEVVENAYLYITFLRDL